MSDFTPIGKMVVAGYAVLVNKDVAKALEGVCRLCRRIRRASLYGFPGLGPLIILPWSCLMSRLRRICRICGTLCNSRS